MLTPNNIKEMREEKDLPLGNPKMNKANYQTILYEILKNPGNEIGVLFNTSI